MVINMKDKKNDTANIGKNALILTFSKILVLTMTMIVTMILSRYLTLKEYGTYSTIILTVNIIITIFVLGLPNSINYFMADATTKEKREFFSIYYLLSTVLCFIAGITLVIAIPFLSTYFKNENLKLFWFVLAFLPWTKVILTSIDNFLIVANKTKLLMIFKVANSVALLGTAILALTLKFNLQTYMLIFVIIEIVFSIIAFFISKLQVENIKINFSYKVLKDILKFSIPLGFAAVVGTLTTELGKIVIAGFFDSEKLAIYTNASKEMPVTIIGTSLAAVLMPQLVKLFKQNKKDQAMTLWRESTTLSYIFICFFAMILFFNAKEVITLLYSSKYLPGTDVFKIYSIVLLFRTTYFGMILNSIGKTKFILYSSILSLLSNVILSYVCYYLFGFNGPAIAMLLSMALIVVFQLMASAKKIKIKFKEMMNWQELLKITIINVMLAIIFNYFKIILSTKINSNLSLIISIFIWTIAYMIIVKKDIFTKWRNLKIKE